MLLLDVCCRLKRPCSVLCFLLAAELSGFQVGPWNHRHTERERSLLGLGTIGVQLISPNQLMNRSSSDRCCSNLSHGQKCIQITTRQQQSHCCLSRTGPPTAQWAGQVTMINEQPVMTDDKWSRNGTTEESGIEKKEAFACTVIIKVPCKL
jgi:hypothetical protein